jgi:hypothetical protein
MIGITGAFRTEVPYLPLGRYKLRFRSAGGIRTDRFLGSAWRGVFGRALKKLVCITRAEECHHCMLYRSCVYPYVFETPPPENTEKLPSYFSVPHPFVLSVPWDGKSEDGDHNLELTLIGRGNQCAAYVILALKIAAEEGVNPLGPLTLAGVQQESAAGSGTWTEIFADGAQLNALAPAAVVAPPAPALIRIHLESPLRLRHENSYVSAERFEFADLFRNILRRVSFLTYFHTERPLETDFAGLVHRSREVGIGNTVLRWRDWTRYSTRQQEKLQMGGLVGGFSVRLGGIEDLWPYLWLGQWVHAGKGATMGLGRYRITELET